MSEKKLTITKKENGTITVELLGTANEVKNMILEAINEHEILDSLLASVTYELAKGVEVFDPRLIHDQFDEDMQQSILEGQMANSDFQSQIDWEKNKKLYSHE